MRAGMVSHPGQYTWSSYRANAMGAASTLIKPHPLYLSLAPTPTERQYAYLSLFGTEGDSDAEIRIAVNGGLPLGRPAFVCQLKERLEERTTPGRDGRPKGRKTRRSAMQETGV